MKHVKTTGVRRQFQPLLASRSLQAAVMVLQPGGASSDRPEDEHPQAEQWLYVVSGTGQARGTRGKPLKLNEGSLLLIEKRQPHQIKNTGRTPLVTLNFYAPPAYTKAGDVRSTVKS